MKPGTKIVKDTTRKIDHDITVTGVGKESSASCFTCGDQNQVPFPSFARGSRNHVNRQVRLHRSKKQLMYN